MKKSIPDSIVVPGHPDYDLLTSLADEITKRAGGTKALGLGFSAMIRQCVDDVIMTPNSHLYFDYYQSADTASEAAPSNAISETESMAMVVPLSVPSKHFLLARSEPAHSPSARSPSF